MAAAPGNTDSVRYREQDTTLDDCILGIRVAMIRRKETGNLNFKTAIKYIERNSNEPGKNGKDGKTDLLSYHINRYFELGGDPDTLRTLAYSIFPENAPAEPGAAAAAESNNMNVNSGGRRKHKSRRNKKQRKHRKHRSRKH